MRNFLTAAAVLALATSAQATIRITEYMYNPAVGNGEFVEFTNVGTTTIDMTNWSFDDSSRSPGSFDLSPAGNIGPGESFVLTESLASVFATVWGLSGVTIVGGNDQNLARGDEINIYDANDVLVDRLTYGDLVFPGTIRTVGVSGNPLSAAALGANNVTQWGLSSVGDSFGSYAATTGDIGNPGSSVYVPEPTSIALLMLGGLAAIRRGRAR